MLAPGIFGGRRRRYSLPLVGATGLNQRPAALAQALIALPAMSVELPPVSPPGSWLADAERLDLAVYAAIAATPSPTVDRAMSRLTRAADYSKLSLLAAAGLATFGGRNGRRAAIDGLVAVAVTATVVNAGLKLIVRRRRPDQAAAEVPITRQVRMPVSRSFPSGHSAAAFAFATGVAGVHARCRHSPPRHGEPGRVLARTYGGPLPGRRARGGAGGDQPGRADGMGPASAHGTDRPDGRT